MDRKLKEYDTQRFVDFYLLNERNKAVTVKHFKSEQKGKKAKEVVKRRIYRVIKRYEDENRVKFKKLSGRPAIKSSPENIAKVKKILERNPTSPLTVLAQKNNFSDTTFRRIKKEKLQIKSYKQQEAPKYREGQAERSQVNCGIILKKAEEKMFIMDDESYVPFDPKQVKGPKFYHCKSKKDAPHHIKYKRKEKYAEKVMVWQAIDEEGSISEPFYLYKKHMNGEIYLEECLKKRLLPFIERNREIKDVCFWFDMAGCHYKTEVTAFLDKIGLSYIKRDENAPNVPQARPIERFWCETKKLYAKYKTKTKNMKEFDKRWRECSAQVAERMGFTLMSKTRQKLKDINENGVFNVV
jgi:hypothetical protein